MCTLFDLCWLSCILFVIGSFMRCYFCFLFDLAKTSPVALLCILEIPVQKKFFLGSHDTCAYQCEVSCVKCALSVRILMDSFFSEKTRKIEENPREKGVFAIVRGNGSIATYLQGRM